MTRSQWVAAACFCGLMTASGALTKMEIDSNAQQQADRMAQTAWDAAGTNSYFAGRLEAVRTGMAPALDVGNASMPGDSARYEARKIKDKDCLVLHFKTAFGAFSARSTIACEAILADRLETAPLPNYAGLVL